MAYLQEKSPDPYYVVSVNIKKVVPAYGAGAAHHDRQVEDVVSVTISGKTKIGAIKSAVSHLENEMDEAMADDMGRKGSV
jgi:hypothetical protein